jgi:pre-mRNA-processing factor 6
VCDFQVARARSLLQRARERAGTPRVWLKSAVLERDLGKDDDQRALLDESLRRYPQGNCLLLSAINTTSHYRRFRNIDAKLWMMRAQLAERAASTAGGETLDDARRFYERGLRNAPTSIALWLCLTRLELHAENYAKARAVLEKARLKNPRTPELWREVGLFWRLFLVFCFPQQFISLAHYTITK